MGDVVPQLGSQQERFTTTMMVQESYKTHTHTHTPNKSDQQCMQANENKSLTQNSLYW